MERDLSVIRKRRAERDSVHRASRAGESLKHEFKLSPKDGEILAGEALNDAAGKGNETLKEKDLARGDDGTTTQLQEPQDTNHAQEAIMVARPEDVTAVQGMPQDSANSAGLAIVIPSGPKAKGKEPSKNMNGSTPKTSATATDAILAADQTTETPKTSNFDFESMFNDTDFVHADGSMNFGVDFPTTERINEDMLIDSAFNDVIMSNTDTGSLLPTTNEDINALLPGFDAYVNAGNNTAGGNDTIPSSLPQGSRSTIAETTSTAAATTTEPAATESAFDGNFFDADNFTMGDGTLGEFDQFDDAWFNT